MANGNIFQGLLENLKKTNEAFLPPEVKEALFPQITPQSVGSSIRNIGQAVPEIPGAIKRGVQTGTSAVMANPAISEFIGALTSVEPEAIQSKAMQDLTTEQLIPQFPGTAFGELPQEIQQATTPSIVNQQLPQQPVAPPTGVQPEAPIPQPQQPQDSSGLQSLLSLLIPGLTAGIGLGVPGALPGAAGFQQGFTGEQQRQRVSKEKSQEAAKKAERELVQTVALEELKASLKKDSLSSGDVNNIQKILTKNKGIFGQKKGPAFDLATTFLSQKGLALDEKGNVRVRFIDPQGSPVTIPPAQIQQALDSGFTRR